MNMGNPWLSVIIPSHNDQRWLGAALRSLVDQNDSGIEVIVIDASATDANLRIVSGFSEQLNIWARRRLDLSSWAEKANFAVEQARADRICILHPDDLWLPNRCAKLRKWLATQSDSVMHLHPSYFIDESGRRLGLWQCPLPDQQSPVEPSILFERLLVQNFIAVPGPTIRRDAFLKVGGMDSHLWHTTDWDLYFKVASVGNVYYHSCPLACYRLHKTSLGMQGIRAIDDFRKQYEIVMDRHLEKVSPARRNETLRLARASINVNVALAAGVSGNVAPMGKALASVLALGPRGIYRYLFYSRIFERTFSRVRALVTDECDRRYCWTRVAPEPCRERRRGQKRQSAALACSGV
jgi:glycosyltransferase involved in cell wall biosynthesis